MIQIKASYRDETRGSLFYMIHYQSYGDNTVAIVSDLMVRLEDGSGRGHVGPSGPPDVLSLVIHISRIAK